ncbi:unnamed protein product [Moneuplotes crassus]|uniref:Uncharacterized protein n=1 Tax=Euplotes crassus TaxID=5936 RepID=A0AAD1X6I4_EUPCR|nr:unnamed protein product [Moneuplotes crassus]
MATRGIKRTRAAMERNFEEDKEEVKVTKCKRGKKICTNCTKNGLSGLNPINCKKCQICGFVFNRNTQNATNIMKGLSKLGCENYAYMETVSSEDNKLSIFLNKTRTFYQNEENVSLKKRDLKKMKKEQLVLINPCATKVPKHLSDKQRFCDYQTIHMTQERFEKLNHGLTPEDNELDKKIKIVVNPVSETPEDPKSYEMKGFDLKRLEKGLLALCIPEQRIKSCKWIPIEEYIHENSDNVSSEKIHDIVNYCSILTHTRSGEEDLYRIIIVQIQKEEGKVYEILTIPTLKDQKVKSVTQVEWMPIQKNRNKFFSQCVVLCNTDQGSYLQVYRFTRKESRESNCLELCKTIKLNKTSVELLSCKAMGEYLAIGDSAGNIYIFKVAQKKSKEVKHTEYEFSLFKIFKNAHEMEISGLEFITNSLYYENKVILSSISKDGSLRLWDINGSSFYPVHEVCGNSRRWMYDIVWDPSIQSNNDTQQIQYNIEGRHGSYQMVYFDDEFSSKKSNLIKENTTSISSRHTSCQILLSSINGCVYSIEKQAKMKGKSKSINPEVIFRIEKQLNEEESFYSLKQIPPRDNKILDQVVGTISDKFFYKGKGKEHEDYLFEEQNCTIKDVKYCITNSDKCFISLRKDLVFIKTI